MKATLRNGTLLATGLVFVLSGALIAQKATSTSPSGPDLKFAKEAATGGMTEVEMGKVAVQKASNEKVKEFGQRMIDDHSKAGEKLKSLAAKENITLPTELDAKHKSMVDKFSAMSGAAFDRAYMRDMVKDHQEDVADFQKEANSGSNDALKTFAATTLPTLQEHLRIAKETESSLGTTSSKK